MPTVDATFFKMAIELAAPSLAARGLLNSPSGVGNAADIVVNAYSVVIAAYDKIGKGKSADA